MKDSPPFRRCSYCPHLIITDPLIRSRFPLYSMMLDFISVELHTTQRAIEDEQGGQQPLRMRDDQLDHAFCSKLREALDSHLHMISALKAAQSAQNALLVDEHTPTTLN